MEGMNYQAFWKFIQLLHDNDLLQYVEVVGSWCEYLYAQSGYLPGFTASLRTLDVDFLIKSLKRPANKANLSSIAADNGYTIDHDCDAVVYQLRDKPGSLRHGAGESVKLGDDKGVPAAELRPQFLKLRAGHFGPGKGVGIDVFLVHTLFHDRLDLGFKRIAVPGLTGGTDARVSE